MIFKTIFTAFVMMIILVELYSFIFVRTDELPFGKQVKLAMACDIVFNTIVFCFLMGWL